MKRNTIDGTFSGYFAIDLSFHQTATAKFGTPNILREMIGFDVYMQLISQ